MYGDHRYLHVLTHPCPTRRSSELPARAGRVADHGCEIEAAAFDDALHFRRGKLATRRGGLAVMLPERPADVDDVILQYFPQLAHVGDQCSVAVELRSEEHTSELQSLMRISYAVFCLQKNTE